MLNTEVFKTRYMLQLNVNIRSILDSYFLQIVNRVSVESVSKILFAYHLTLGSVHINILLSDTIVSL